MKIKRLGIVLQSDTEPPQLTMAIGIDDKTFGAVTTLPPDFADDPEIFKVGVREIFQAVIRRIEAEEAGEEVEKAEAADEDMDERPEPEFPGCWGEKNTVGGMDKEGHVTMDESEEADAKG